MAKKILSFLCALAVLVSMTAIGLSAVLAEETATADFPALSDGTITAAETAVYGSWESTKHGSDVLYLSNSEVDVAFADALNVDGDFEFSFIMDRAYGNTDGVTVKLGKLEIAALTSGAPQQKVVIKYDGTELAASSATSWGQWNNYKEDNKAEDDLYGSDFIDEIHTNVNSGLYAGATTTYNFYAVKVTVTYDSETGVVKACIGNPSADLTGTTGFKSVEATLTDADFSNAALSINIKDTKEFYHTALYGFQGTYTPVVTEVGGGDDVALSTADLPALSDGTATAAETAVYGIWESTKHGSDVLYLSNSEVDVAFADALNVDGDFEFSFIMDRAYGNTDGVTVKLGKLEIAALTSGAPQQKVVIKYDGTELAASSATSWGQWNNYKEDNKAEDDLYGSDFIDEIHTNVNSGLYAGATTTYNFYAVKVTVTYDSETGVVKACIGNPSADLTGTTGFKSVEATLTDADFSNAALSINIKDTKEFYHTALYGFQGTYETASDAGENGDGGENGDDGDDGEEAEAIVVTFDATKGTVETATATVNADGKLDTLPTPTYSGVGVYVFEGWFTSAVDGEKITADTVFTENTTVYAQWKRTITTTKMDTFKEVTEDDITRPEDGTPWNSGGSGLFYVENIGYGLGCGGYTTDDNSISATIGTYNIGTYFKTNFDLWFKNKGVNNGAIAKTQNWYINIGDLTIWITRSPSNITTQEGQNLYVQSVTYKGKELTLDGDQHFSKKCAVVYEWNSEFVINNATEHYAYVSDDDFMLEHNYTNIASYWGSNNHYPNVNMGFAVEYDMGVLTISNTTGTEVNVLSVDLTAVEGFDVATAFNNAKVSVNMSTRKEANTTISLISNFEGVYEVAATSNDGNGSGSGNAPQTGDNRNIVLPICVAMASVAVAGATLFRRKRA